MKLLRRFTRVIRRFREPRVEPIALPFPVLIGTHHKAGTVWLWKVFRRISQRFALTAAHGRDPVPPSGMDIYQHSNSRFDLARITHEFRGVHMVRDPRDMLVSATFYHRKSSEAWLHLPREKFDGRTYQQTINALPTFEEQLAFEIDHTTGGIINEMGAWNYDNPSFMELKYEHLMSDLDLQLFHKLFSFLGFPGHSIPGALAIAYDNSLFSGRATTTPHVRSGQSGQWREHFSPALRQRFHDRFGDILVRLGYEPDNRWVTTS